MTAPVAATSTELLNITGSSATVTGNKPTSTADADLLLFFYMNGFTGGPTGFTPPAGLNLLQSKLGSFMAAAVYSRVAASEGSTYAFNATGTGPYEGGVHIVRITGADGSSPVITSVTPNYTVTGSTGTYPTVTTPSADNIVIQFGCCDVSATQTGSTFPTIVPSGSTLIKSSINAADAQYMQSAWFNQVSAGATGSKTVATPAGIYEWIGFTIAVAPGAGGGGGGTLTARLLGYDMASGTWE